MKHENKREQEIMNVEHIFHNTYISWNLQNLQEIENLKIEIQQLVLEENDLNSLLNQDGFL